MIERGGHGLDLPSVNHDDEWKADGGENGDDGEIIKK